MTEPWNEAEFNDYIEGELDEPLNRAMETRLEADPAMRTRVERMRSDRAVLQSLAAVDLQPGVPDDLLSQLEPQIARSVLMAPTDAVGPPGAYRRRHRDQTRGTRRTRFAVAAGVVLTLFAAIWAALAFLGQGSSVERNIDQAPGAPVGDAGSAAPKDALVKAVAPGDGNAERWPPSDATLHHDAPLPPGPGFALQRPLGTGPNATPPSADAPIVTATFALVLPASDADEAEALLARALVAVDEDDARDPVVSLVRNLSFAEGRYLMARLASDGHLDRRTRDLIIGLGPSQTARNVRQLGSAMKQLRRNDLPDDEMQRLSRQLLGAKRLAPSYEEQIELSRDGATYTVTVPVASLGAWLERLRVDEALPTMLRPLAGDDDVSDRSALQRWLHDYRAVKSFLSGLDQAERNGFVKLPVVITKP